MKRPLSDKRPIGPFAIDRPECDLSFAATYRVTDSETMSAVADEFTDNMEASLNTKFEEEFDESPVEAVRYAGVSDKVYRFFVVTELSTITDSMEHMMLDELERELVRLTDGVVAEQSYKYMA